VTAHLTLLLLLLLLLAVRFCCTRLHTWRALLHKVTLQRLLAHAQLLSLSAGGSLRSKRAAKQQITQQDKCDK
jgi:hypothetical protein